MRMRVLGGKRLEIFFFVFQLLEDNFLSGMNWMGLGVGFICITSGYM